MQNKTTSSFDLHDVTQDNRLTRVEDMCIDNSNQIAGLTVKVEEGNKLLLEKMDRIGETVSSSFESISKAQKEFKTIHEGNEHRLTLLEAQAKAKEKWNGVWRKVIGGTLLALSSAGIAALFKFLLE